MKMQRLLPYPRLKRASRSVITSSTLRCTLEFHVPSERNPVCGCAIRTCLPFINRAQFWSKRETSRGNSSAKQFCRRSWPRLRRCGADAVSLLRTGYPGHAPAHPPRAARGGATRPPPLIRRPRCRPQPGAKCARMRGRRAELRKREEVKQGNLRIS